MSLFCRFTELRLGESEMTRDRGAKKECGRIKTAFRAIWSCQAIVFHKIVFANALLCCKCWPQTFHSEQWHKIIVAIAFSPNVISFNGIQFPGWTCPLIPFNHLINFHNSSFSERSISFTFSIRSKVFHSNN